MAGPRRFTRHGTAAGWLIGTGMVWLATSSPAATLSTIEANLGADAFYNQGYTGSRVIIADVEAGLTSNTHAVLDDGRVARQVRFTGSVGSAAAATFTDHATETGGVMVAENNGTTGHGVAYGATLWTAQLASSFGSGGSFSLTTNSFVWPLMVVAQTGINSSGVVGGTGARTASVVSSSWGATDNTGNTIINVVYDYLAYAQGTTMVISAGNAGQGAGTVAAPANSWNVIAVGATSGSSSNDTVTSFSSGGPTGSFNLTGTRTKPDIVAPGTSIVMPTYPGTTSYATASGTSFSAPIVAAGAALIVDMGQATGRETNARVIKAVLLNSADKLTGWTQSVATNSLTGTRTNYTPLDASQGAGEVDFARAYTQYAASTGEGSHPVTAGVSAVGWDYNTVTSAATTQNYFFGTQLAGGSTLTATLIWFMERIVTGFDASSSNPTANASFLNERFDDLDLLLYKTDAAGHIVGNAVAASISGWDPNNPSAAATGLDSVEHLYLAVPSTAYYLLQVRWTQNVFNFTGPGVLSDQYALAWSTTMVPEPATWAIMMLGAAVIFPRRTRR